jgi:hypothetical protein
VSFAKFLFLTSWFAKLLEANFSFFAKIIWMPSWFAKLLELLLHSTNGHMEVLRSSSSVFFSESTTAVLTFFRQLASSVFFLTYFHAYVR